MLYLYYLLCVICIEVDAETKESTNKTEEKLHGRYMEGHERKKPKEGQREDRKQWSLGVGQRRKTFLNRYIYMCVCVCVCVCVCCFLIVWLWFFTGRNM